MLQSLGFKPIVYSFRNHEQWPWTTSAVDDFRDRFKDAELVLDDQTTISAVAQKVRSLVSFGGGPIARAVLSARLPGMTPELEKLAARRDILATIVSYPWGITHLNGRPPGKFIVDTHDLAALEKFSSSGVSRWGNWLHLKREMYWLSMVDEVWSISQSEYWFLQSLLGTARVRLVPPSLTRWRRLEHLAGEPRYDLVFVGSNNRWNATSLTRFLEQTLAWDMPLRIAIAGAICQSADVKRVAAQCSNTDLLGFVDDLDALYGQAAAAVCPVEGTGTKIKIIEALRAGLPVFVAPGSFSGLLPGHEKAVLPIARDTLSSVLRHPGALSRAREAAERYAELYGMEAVTDLVRPAFAEATP